MALGSQDAALIKGMLARGDKQSDIAAYFGVNSGRISEIHTGGRLAHVKAVTNGQLPPPGPYIVSARVAMKATETLKALRDLIDETLTEIEAWERMSRQG